MLDGSAQTKQSRSYIETAAYEFVDGRWQPITFVRVYGDPYMVMAGGPVIHYKRKPELIGL